MCVHTSPANIDLIFFLLLGLSWWCSAAHQHVSASSSPLLSSRCWLFFGQTIFKVNRGETPISQGPTAIVRRFLALECGVCASFCLFLVGAAERWAIFAKVKKWRAHLFFFGRPNISALTHFEAHTRQKKNDKPCDASEFVYLRI